MPPLLPPFPTSHQNSLQSKLSRAAAAAAAEAEAESDAATAATAPLPPPPYRLRFMDGPTAAATTAAVTKKETTKETVVVEAYTAPPPGPYPQDQPKKNTVNLYNLMLAFVVVVTP